MPNTWKNLPIKEKFQIVNGTSLVMSAIVLYFIAFLLTRTVGFEVVSAGATLLASGLAFFGITSFVKHQMLDSEKRLKTEMNQHLERMEEMRLQRDIIQRGGDVEEVPRL